MRCSFKTRPLVMAAGLATLLLFVGCGASKRTFVVYSWPAGATVFLNEEARGQTKCPVQVDFGETPYATIRVEMNGYQPAGTLVTPTSPEALSFVLEIAPESSRR